MVQIGTPAYTDPVLHNLRHNHLFVPIRDCNNGVYIQQDIGKQAAGLYQYLHG